jgi:two-component system KDP operon response regulator KdpE
MTSAPSILVIEDEPQICRFVRVSLECQGYRITEAHTAAEGLGQATAARPDAIVLDLGLPDLDGLIFLKQLREWSRVPVIVLSARGREQDKVEALDTGANDYLTKPFGIGELLARIRAALRTAAVSAGTGSPPVFEVGQLRVDLAYRRVVVEDHEVRLTPTQYRLLATLVQHAGKVVTHQQLLREVWGADYLAETVYLRVYVGQIRQKIERDPTRPRYLLTEPGVGYRLACE